MFERRKGDVYPRPRGVFLGVLTIKFYCGGFPGVSAMRIAPFVLLIFSNIFMAYAWYGHLKDMRTRPLVVAIVFSWCIAFFEYCLQVPANRIGSTFYTLPQLKIIQEILTMVVFAGFCVFYMGLKLTWDYLWASLCLAGAAFFIFRHMPA